MGILAYIRHSAFYIDSIVAVLTLSAASYWRKKIIFSWEGALLVCLGFILNVSGVIGTYDLSYRGIGGDKLIHFVSMAGLAILIYSFLESKNALSGKKIFGTVTLIILALFISEGLGAINEINEFVGSKYFGIDKGMFSMANGSKVLQSDFDHYDTQWDMIFNTFGSIAGVLYISIKSRLHHHKKLKK